MKKIFILAALFVLTLSSATLIDNDVTTYKIGDKVSGGIVFYIAPSPIDLDGDGKLDNGLVCSLENIGKVTEWGCEEIDLKNVSNVSSDPPSGLGANLGDGMKNTNAILKDCPTAPAALAARSLGVKWFLPSINELKEIYKNKAILEKTEGFTKLYSESFSFWSSTENDSSGAWFMDVLDVGFESYGGKYDPGAVRAVRTF